VAVHGSVHDLHHRIAYRRDHITDDEVRAYDDPYEILWDPKYTGR
jgi:hypothetical protein